MKFWDASAIIPICIEETQTRAVQDIARKDGSFVVWWGSIVECYSAFSRLRRDGATTRDEDAQVRAVLTSLRNQLRAIAFGAGNNTLDIPFLPTNVDIKVGDKLVTSGIDGVYPAGLAVATVTKIQQNPESPFAKIVSTPVAGVSNHLQLLLLALPETKEVEAPVLAPTSASAPEAAAGIKKDKENIKNKAKPNAPH